MSCGVGCKHGLDLTLLWLWHSPVATALIRPLAWEPPCATGAALEKAKRHTHTHIKVTLIILIFSTFIVTPIIVNYHIVSSEYYNNYI